MFYVKFLVYWFAIRDHRAWLKDKQSLFENYVQLKKTLPVRTLKHNLRTSTIHSSNETELACLQRSYGFPSSVGTWFNKFSNLRQFLRGLDPTLNYKWQLKKHMKFRREIFRMFTDDIIKKGIKETNEKYFLLYSA